MILKGVVGRAHILNLSYVNFVTNIYGWIMPLVIKFFHI